MINIEEFKKVNFIVGEIKEINENKIVIVTDNNEFITHVKLNSNKGDKIVFIISDNNAIIPLVGENNPIIPEKQIKPGSKIN